MLIAAALLFIIIAFLFYIRPVFIALVLGILVTVMLNKIIDIFYKATKNYTSTQRKIIALVSSASIVLVILILIFAGAMNLINNIGTIIDSFENFTGQYNETAGDLAEEITNITFEEAQIRINQTTPRNETDINLTYKITADPPPAASPGATFFGLNLSTTTVVQSLLTAGGGLMTSTRGTVSFIATTLFACCLIIPIMAGYYFKEKGNMRTKFIALVPVKYRETVGRTIHDVVNDIDRKSVV